MENSRTTPTEIVTLSKNEIFVFGSNESGFHGAGAARDALKWGARYGEGVGLFGSTYAIPTKSHFIRRSLTIEEIKPYVDDFILFVKKKPNKIFLVTEIGCGLANNKPEDIAPLFLEAKEIQNIFLPKRFWEILNKNYDRRT
jgi:hypothetical protein